MDKSVGQPLQFLLLPMVWSGMVIVFTHALLAPESAKSPSSPNISLPKNVALPNWQLGDASPIAIDSNSKVRETLMPPGMRYQYQQESRILVVEMHPFVSDGNVSRFVSTYSPIRSGNIKMLNGQRYMPNVGYYSVLTHKGSAYLTACITPVGDSTVTEPQFKQSPFKAFDPVRFARWFLGQAPLTDDRCLWTLMTMPLPRNTGEDSTSKTVDSTYQELETIWVDWYRWWKANFPHY